MPRDPTPRDPSIVAGLVLAVLAVYAQTLGFDFVAYDDPFYVTGNAWVKAGLGSEGLRAAFLEPSAPVNWSPLVVLSFMLDATLFGVDPAGFHATNVALHALGAVLAFALLRALTGTVWPSALVAALFALHPLRVESVAWVSSRKDVLSAVFGLLSLLAYVRFARSGARSAYAAAFAAAAAALLAKSLWVTLPCLFLLLDLWPLRRLGPAFGAAALPLPAPAGRRAGPARLVAEKLPFFALGLALTLATVSFQEANRIPSHAIASVDRLVHATAASAWYLVKTLWPAGLALHYPHPFLPPAGGTPWSGAVIAGAAALLGALSALALRGWRRGYPLVGWLWFLGTLVPVLGFVQYGTQGMADRYTHLPHLGLFTALVFAGRDALGARLERRQVRAALAAALVALLLGLGAASWRQARSWRDTDALFARSLEVSPRSALIHKETAIQRIAAGRYDEALRHTKAALDVYPAYPKALTLLRRALAARPDGPAPTWLIDGGPGDAVVHEELASWLYTRGDADAALDHVRAALDLTPDSPRAHWQHGILLRERGDHAAAAEAFRRLVALAPESSVAREALEAAERASEATP